MFLLAGFATNIYFMIISRAIQGIGMSSFPIAFSIVRDRFPREKMSIGNGVLSSMTAAGAVIGLIVGGSIIKDYGWQATFFTITPIAIALLITIRRFIHLENEQEEEGRGRRNRIELPSIIRKENSNSDDKYRKRNDIKTIDIKGAITLAIAVTSFLLVTHIHASRQ